MTPRFRITLDGRGRLVSLVHNSRSAGAMTANAPHAVARRAARGMLLRNAHIPRKRQKLRQLLRPTRGRACRVGPGCGAPGHDPMARRWA